MFTVATRLQQPRFPKAAQLLSNNNKVKTLLVCHARLPGCHGMVFSVPKGNSHIILHPLVRLSFYLFSVTDV